MTGPTTAATEKILSLLNNHNRKALFFCVGNNVSKHPGLVKEILDQGHSIGNHTYNHQIITKVDSERFIQEIDSVSNLLENSFNYQIKYFRPPHGRFNFSTQKSLKKKNLKNIMWSLLTYDYKNNLNIVKFAVKNYLRKDSIVVMHESLKSKNIILDSILFVLEEAEKSGFEIGEPSECLR